MLDRMITENVKALAFDLDGTLYFGNEAVDGAIELLSRLKREGIMPVFFTNNSARTVGQIVAKLCSLGFDADDRNTYTASYACARYLAQERIERLYLLGSDDFGKDLMSRGMTIVEPNKAEAVVVGLDFGLNYESIAGALQAIMHGAILVVANLDASYPIEYGRRLPGCGAMVGAVTGASGHEPDFIAGKPNTYMLDLLCGDLGLSNEDICVVGDSVESDIEMANRFKCRSILYDHYDNYCGYSGERVNSLKDIIDILN
jgi:arabinose operon protein AraL